MNQILMVFIIYTKAGGNLIKLLSMMIFSSLVESILLLSIIFYINKVISNNIFEKLSFLNINSLSHNSAINLLSITYVFFFIVGISLRFYFMKMVNINIENVRTKISACLTELFFQNDQKKLVLNKPKELSKIICTEVDLYVSGVLRPILQMCVNFSVLFIIIIVLIWTNPVVALIALSITTLIFLILNLLLKNKILIAGTIRSKANSERFRMVNEIFDGLKTLIHYDAKSFAINRIQREVSKLSRSQAVFQTLQQLTPMIFEVIIMCLIVGMSILLNNINNDKVFDSLLFEVGIFGLAAYKLKPFMQSLFNGISTLRYNREILEKLNNFLIHYTPYKKNYSKLMHNSGYSLLINSTKLIDLHGNSIIKELNLELKPGYIYRLKSPSGSGKTTLLNQIAGLVVEESMDICFKINNESVNINNFHRKEFLSYVQQNTFIFSGTILENISLCNESISKELIYNVAKIVQLDKYIDKNNFNYKNFNALNLSGGEKQRIEIARALLSLKYIILMDEPFSGLDDNSTSMIMQYFNSVKHNKIIIITSHNNFIDKYIDNEITL